MKFIYFLSLLLIVFALFSFLPIDFRDKILFPFQSDDKYISKPAHLVHQILYETSLSINKKYKIDTIGTVVAMPGGDIQAMGLEFNSYQKLSKEQMRKLLVEFSRELLHNINSNEEIQPYLTKRPFTLENIKISIFNHDERGHWTSDPDIGIGRVHRGLLSYSTYDPDNEFGYKNNFEETYEEALKLIQEEDHPPKSK